VVLAGDVPAGVVACSVESGEVRWCWRPPGQEKCGRGLIAEGRALVPTGKALYELSLGYGQVESRRSLPVGCREVTGLVWGAGSLVAAYEEGLLFWSVHATSPPTGLDETYSPFGEPRPPASEPALGSAAPPEPATSAWAPVAAVAGAGAQMAVFPAEGGEDVVSWDGQWLSL